ncbi:fumarylacetoacetate hydrolase family protein [Roseateles sp. BYS180W]|uniref:Fumarylacetoacetate hydrolase family protein n=1 Tax=Roseateles rivi TaxID=3299028 RepID=A0ABW7FWD5_9BURK
MKLLRVGPVGAEKPAVLDAQGQLRDLSVLLPELTPALLAPAALQALSGLDLERLPLVTGSPRLGCPIAGIGKIICVGLNYRDHAKESGMEPPAEPVLFLKATSSLSGPNDPIIIPRGSLKTDWEVELGVVIGSTTRYVSRDQAMAHVAGYCLINDVSERAFQLERGGQWDKGKGCDSFSPVGPWLVTRDEVADPGQLALWLDVNGQRKQDGHTSNLIFDVPTLVSYISQFMSLQPGDIISTGTPAGVGLGQKPEPWYLKAGDRVRLGIAGLGEQEQLCVSADSVEAL